ncbi:apolipoprotein N-acyltransferase [Thermithiobacillus plumbiphilus]|uniref:Apolipoprotein N-acyltransferase n=1 Tax=Thermithiobacillus plumbiphilus TaxID=1729899 RepID=A0ABU9D5Z4_9PROT
MNPERSLSPAYPAWAFPRPVSVWSAFMALLLGLAWPLGFAPFNLSALPLLILAALFALLARQGPKAAFAHTYLFALAAFGAGLYWISHTLHAFGGMSWPVAILLMLLLSAYLALFPAIALGLARRVFPERGPLLLIALPAFWVLGEWLRGHLFTGFPWLTLGYSQATAPLGGLAPWLGTYGISLVAAWMAGLLAWSWAQETRRAIWLVGFPVVMGVMLASHLLGQVSFSRPAGQPTKVYLLQGNIPQAVKWSPEQVEPTIKRYVDLLLSTPPGTQLVVMPESAIPLFRDEVPTLLQAFSRWALNHDAEIVLGIDERVARGQVVDYYNSAIALDGRRVTAYRKRHLVPFGEYLPLRPLISRFASQLVPGEGDFSSGQQIGVLPVGSSAAGISICYEAAFADEIRSDVVGGARFLLNISNDDWFGNTVAPYQHLQMGQMRARESERFLARATNTGITVIVGPDGQIQARLPQFKPGALTGVIQGRSGLTPYARHGDGPVFLAAALLIAFALLWQMRARRRLPVQAVPGM